MSARHGILRVGEVSWGTGERQYNLIRRIRNPRFVLADGEVTADDLPDHVRSAGSIRRVADAGAFPVPVDLPASLGPTSLNLREIKEWAGREAQKRVILELQKRTNISRQELARLLGVDPKTLRSRLKEISGDLDY